MTKNNQSKTVNDDTLDSSNIISAVFERDDPFYDSVASIWNLDLNYLDEDGQKSRMFININIQKLL